jgi:hypothetical protein
MGFGPWGKKEEPAAAAKGGSAAKTGLVSVKEAGQPAPSTHDAPAASSVFEFGPVVPVGQDFMRGVCVGDDPDAIQACTWSVEPAQRSREKHHHYRIEF